jgi:FAD/FMN-containing dehydrogenase
MNGVRVDPDARVADAQSRILLGELDRRTQEHGMAVPAGIVSHAGLAGLTLGGEIGWIMRKYGLTVDSLQSADLVIPDGEFVRASQDENADLFWGLRGGAATPGWSPTSGSGSTPWARRSWPA